MLGIYKHRALDFFSYYFQSGQHDHAVFIFNDNAIEGFVEFYHNNKPLLPFNHSYTYPDIKNWIATGIYQYGFFSCGFKCTILRRYQARTEWNGYLLYGAVDKDKLYQNYTTTEKPRPILKRNKIYK